MKQETAVTRNEHGDEAHPAFGLIEVTRLLSSTSTPLFGSDVKHHHVVRVNIKAASRQRTLNRDWLHGGQEYISVEMSEAQWASFISTMNSADGVPCTIVSRNGEDVPSFPYDPRLAHSVQEAKDAAQKAFEHIKQAMTDYEALDAKAPAKTRREALRNLRDAIDNATPNVEYAGRSLIEMTENVVQKARADVEAFVVAKAQHLGLEMSDFKDSLAIEAHPAATGQPGENNE